ncbi:putative membrane protein [Lederbergia galactosidilyticus]|uniref:QueT transporter family protein n=1 Tax=Lederbergia galactosidilytica TaxID=217031 RepID=UPI001AE4CA04|nr:QueT transporter family protein [Lederbergia galactosidilytica]MBP1914967.1 putative membrane protein [Lederbergia galactosidilytica]
MKTKTLVINSIVGALYIAVTALIHPFGFTNIQFRLSEIFNHLVIFNKKYIFGVGIGVFLANLFFSELGLYDLIFGVGQSIIALSITIFSGKFIKGIWKRMIFNTFIFSFTMFIIAIELTLALGFPFWFTWITLAISEFVVMLIGAPLIIELNKRIKFDKLLS